ncbi:hypothetical protein KC207_15530 [Phycicoccus sp. BSK3Z-2]|uniref:Uncharacterized protein n=1 Tax=Phycicoccus avicenniae TaxID=2828860 RepID=A0A941DBN1_9MICO|nr:hypothetical protein [Phycicoccus avicenniae]MBR7744708.1 hypothetical protein [Phycicoccus avicenniae]
MLAALLAAAGRVPALGQSLRPDESGYTLVARAWDPRPSDPYGEYWVDRPPLLVAVFRLSDALGGPSAIRWVALAACVLFVLATAAAALEVVRQVRPGATPGVVAAVVVPSALAAAALTSNSSVDAVLAKGEVLSLPLLTGAVWLSLRAVRTGSIALVALAGVLAGLPPGLKQNLVGAVVFGIVLLLATRLRGGLATGATLRMLGAFVGGAALHVVATLIWASVAGVRWGALWYAVAGVRSDALDTIASQSLYTALRRGTTLAEVGITSGLVVVLAWFVLRAVRRHRVLTPVSVALVVMVLVDGVGLLLGGSYWVTYLVPLYPAAALALAVLLAAGTEDRTRRTDRGVGAALVTVVVASSVAAGIGDLRTWPQSQRPTSRVLLGASIGAASQPGDTLTLFRGSADVQLASGLPSPYPYLWSVPGRVLDPTAQELADLMRGPDAPTWFVLAYDLDTAGTPAPRTVGPVLEERYVEIGTGCGGMPVYRLADEPRPDPVLRCGPLRAAAEDG